MKIKLLWKSEFRRNVFTLMTGTTAAQAISISISPILTRIFTPQDFGLFALYMALVSILGVVAAGRYELAIMLPNKDENAFHVVCLSLLITAILTICLLFVVIFYNQSISSLLNNTKISPWLYLLPVSVLTVGCYQVLNYWHNRKKHYKTIAASRITQSGITNLSQLSFGGLGASSGLICGSLLGQISALIFLIRKSARNRENHPKLNLLKIKALAKRFKKFPLVDVPTSLVNIVANQAPNILFAIYFGSSYAGFYYLTQRVLQAPLILISGSVLDVFKQRASEDYKKYGNCKEIYKKTFLSLLLMAMPVTIILYVWIVDIFTFAFGASWRVAGDYAQLLIPALFLRFIVNPLSFIIYIAEKQYINLFGMMILLFLIVFSIFIAPTSHDAVIMISVSYIFTYLFYFFISAKLAGYI